VLTVEEGGPVAPRVEDLVDAVAYPMSGGVAIDTRHEQVVVVGVHVADRGGDGEAKGIGVERPACGAASDAPAAAHGGVVGDRIGAGGRTARELFSDGSGEAVEELLVDGGPAHLFALAA